VRITFHGATRQVTGSSHLLDIGDHRILLDCGLYDSNRFDLDSPNRRMPFNPRSLDAVIVSHAHNDHIGRLPCLIRDGYTGPVYCTPATAEIMGIMLRDSARIQREDLRHAFKRRPNPKDDPNREIRLADTPLFDFADVELLLEALRPLDYGETIDLLPDIQLTLRNAGHILGSAMVQLDFREHQRRRRFLFTGDLGRRNSGLLPDPEIVQDIDILVTESTYGHKTLDPTHRLLKQLHAILLRAHREAGKIIIPAFSLGRTQRMILVFQELFQRYKVKPMPVFVDSPLGLKLTDIHRQFPDAYVPSARQLMDGDPDYFNNQYVHFCYSFEDSRRINFLPGPMVIVAGSGMCEAGRVRHHLRHAIQHDNNAIVIVSYQAEGTLGRQIAEGAEQVLIDDRWFDLNAAVYVLDGFSGHADRDDLAWWYSQIGGSIEHAFVVHGEPEAMEGAVELLQPYVRNPVRMPELDESFEV